MGMAMIIERASRVRDLLLLGALALLGSALAILAVWPTTKDQAALGSAPVELVPGNAGSEFDFGSPEHLASVEVSELSVLPEPTLQELVADSDSGTREEAQVLLALLGEEAAADQSL
jgi:hypothetical protein